MIKYPFLVLKFDSKTYKVLFDSVTVKNDSRLIWYSKLAEKNYEIGSICCLNNEIQDKILTFDMMKYRVLVLNFGSKNDGIDCSTASI